jgi:hypothetical protein
MLNSPVGLNVGGQRSAHSQFDLHDLATLGVAGVAKVRPCVRLLDVGDDEGAIPHQQPPRAVYRDLLVLIWPVKPPATRTHTGVNEGARPTTQKEQEQQDGRWEIAFARERRDTHKCTPDGESTSKKCLGFLFKTLFRKIKTCGFYPFGLQLTVSGTLSLELILWIMVTIDWP